MIKIIYRKIIPKKLRQIIAIIRYKLNNPYLFEADGLATNHITDFMKDEKFIKNYFLAAEGTDYKIFYRAYILNYFANYALRLFDKNENPGCFVELGTFKGLTAKVILLNSDISKKKNINFYLFDTFTGIPLKNIKNEEKENVRKVNENFYNEDVYEFVKKKFSQFPFVKIIKGILPETLNKKNINYKNIQFLHIDLNNVNAEIESIKILYDKILKGAPVLLDDYAYSETFRPQKDAWDKFANERGFEILSLPTGQGLFFKF